MSVPPGFLDEVDRVARPPFPRKFQAPLGSNSPIGRRSQASSGPSPAFIRTLARTTSVPARAEVPGVDVENRSAFLGHGLLLLIHRDRLRTSADSIALFLYYEDVDLCSRASEHA